MFLQPSIRHWKLKEFSTVYVHYTAHTHTDFVACTVCTLVLGELWLKNMVTIQTKFYCHRKLKSNQEALYRMIRLSVTLKFYFRRSCSTIPQIRNPRARTAECQGKTIYSYHAFLYMDHLSPISGRFRPGFPIREEAPSP